MRAFITTVLIVLLTGQVHATIVDGPKLHSWLEADDRIMNARDKDVHDLIEDSRSAGEFLGFIMGATDAMNGKSFCITPATSLSQLRTILIQWIALRPDSTKMQGTEIVAAAFADSFPCSAK